MAAALVTFEGLWLQHWRSKLEQARAGLRATLLIHLPETNSIEVNADDRFVSV